MAAAPGAPAQKMDCASAKTTGTGGNTPAFPAQWFYGLYVLSSVNQCSFATVAQPAPLERSQDLAPASGRQDHTISPFASMPRVTRHRGVHRIPHHVRDDRDTPLLPARNEANLTTCSEKAKVEYFCDDMLTGSSGLISFTKIRNIHMRLSHPAKPRMQWTEADERSTDSPGGQRPSTSCRWRRSRTTCRASPAAAARLTVARQPE